MTESFYEADLDFDEDDHTYDPDDDFAYQEPDCWRCNDRELIRTRRGAYRPCPTCCPTRLDAIRRWISWRWWDLRERLTRGRLTRSEQTFDDEAPF